MECEFQYAESPQPIHPTDWTALARGFCDGRGGPVMVAPSRGKACNESLGSARLEVGQADGDAPGLLGDRLLREEARRGDHAHARVRQLLLLHLRELGLELLAVELAEGDADAEGLGRGDAAEHDSP